MDSETLTFRRYLLDELNDNDRAELDLRLLTDSDFATVIELAEEDLIDDYLADCLSTSERLRFEKHFASPPERQRRILLSRELQRYIKNEGSSPTSTDSSLRTLLSNGFSSRVAQLGFAIGIVLLIVGAVAWLTRSGSASLQTEYAAINAQDLSDLNAFHDIPSVSLLPGSSRGDANMFRLAEGGSDRIFVRMALPYDLADRSKFNVRLGRDGVQLLEFSNLRNYDGGSGKELRLFVPRKLLTKGAYLVQLSPADRNDQTINYSLVFE